ncbi:hypothetical protein FHG87_004223 [Trinorchestia longiramus]|nr:hypothetical protein FHG87_004223 [Trinorchestia longiramus]
MAHALSYSKLRKLVLETNRPELRQLESQLLQSYANKLNSEACRLREEQSKVKQKAEKKFSELENEAASLENEHQAVKDRLLLEQRTALDLYRKEQAASQQIRKAELQCEEMMVDLSLTRDHRAELHREKTLQEEKKRKDHEQLEKNLRRSRQQRDVAAALEHLQDQQAHRVAHAVAAVQQLREGVQQESQQLQQVLHSRSVVRLGTAVRQRRTLKQELRDLRAELDAAEQLGRQEQQARERQREELQQQQELTRQRQLQIRLKSEAAKYEAEREAEYLSILSEVQELECSLSQLTVAARKRRLAQREDETRRLLQVRRLLRHKQHLQLLQEDQLLNEYQALRSEAGVEEERQILLEFAPHLLPHLTAPLLHRLALLHTPEQ